MENKKSSKTLSLKAQILAFIVGGIVLIGLFFLTNYKTLSYANVNKDDLVLVDDFFDSYSKAKNDYKITLKNGDKYIVAAYLIEEDDLKNINEDEAISLYVKDDVIFEIKTNNNEILQIDVCKEKHSNKFNQQIIWFSVIYVVMISLTIWRTLKLKQDESNKSSESIDLDLYKKIQDSITKDGDSYKFKYVDFTLTDNNLYTFKEAILNYIEKDKMIYMIEEDGEAEIIYLFYAMGDKLYYDDSCRKKDELYSLNKPCIWYYPEVEIDNEDKEIIENSLIDLIKEHPDMFEPDLVD